MTFSHTTSSFNYYKRRSIFFLQAPAVALTQLAYMNNGEIERKIQIFISIMHDKIGGVNK